MIISKEYAKFNKMLWDLGSTEEQVHDTLVARDLKGWFRDESECPIAQVFLCMDHLEVRDGFQGIQVGSDILEWCIRSERHEMPVPRHISDFVVNFDDGCYPELDAQEEAEEE